MIVTVGIWIYITVCFLVLGSGITELIKRISGYECKDISLVWTLGLCMTTVYAEYFSLFSGVGKLANGIMIAVLCLILYINRKKALKWCKTVWTEIKVLDKKYIVIAIVFAILFIAISSQKAHHADTDLYHAQAIRWIEDYGVVKGLGNLHNRLAYNSAFMCLQALFSGAFLIGQSTHVVNGYICFCAFGYAMITLLHAKRICPSNMFCGAIICYILYAVKIISSPNTDILALLLVLFILQKWCQQIEKHSQDIGVYCILSVIGAFTVSVKLSAAMIVLLAVKPVFILGKKKKWREILLLGSAIIIAVAPFIIRNILISGYLLYPYSTIDLFDVDWKMSKSVVDFDRREIMIYAKGISDYFQSGMKIREWFPIWWEQQGIPVHVFIGINILLGIWECCNTLKLIHKRVVNWDRVFVFGTLCIILVFWLFSAPNSRYGIVFLFGIPCLVLGDILKKVSYKGMWSGAGLLAVVLIGVFGSCIRERMDEISIKRPGYYIYRECKETDWDDNIMYVALENCYCGYYFLPATPYEKILGFIEMRGDDIQEGFRPRSDVKEIYYNNSGMIYTPVK